MPCGPWVMAQSWHDLLFAHWRIDATALRALIPASLEIEAFDGSAWVGVIPFRMSGIRLRGLPPIPGLAAFPELNVRTYVTDGEKPGVWFFSLDAANRVAVKVARRWFRLPYFFSRMKCENAEEWVKYECKRNSKIETGKSASQQSLRAEFKGRYRPSGEVFQSRKGSLEHFLTERYCLYAANDAGKIFRTEIHHAPWPLQPAEAEIERNTMAEAAGISLPQEMPLLHFAKRLDVRVWGLKEVASDQ
ncbi:MAG: DUF2071 domain-containing protein [Acidobacteria bacterium]|nr:DUF2071 domain-containing protein [Acidobacteriota bacterium]